MKYIVLFVLIFSSKLALASGEGTSFMFDLKEEVYFQNEKLSSGRYFAKLIDWDDCKWEFKPVGGNGSSSVIVSGLCEIYSAKQNTARVTQYSSEDSRWLSIVFEIYNSEIDATRTISFIAKKNALDTLLNSKN
ncbi:hypothetical protein [Aliikangiella sp. IMCC44632]